MASSRGILNIQSLNELTSEKVRFHRNDRPWALGVRVRLTGALDLDRMKSDGTPWARAPRLTVKYAPTIKIKINIKGAEGPHRKKPPGTAPLALNDENP